MGEGSTKEQWHQQALLFLAGTTLTLAPSALALKLVNLAAPCMTLRFFEAAALVLELRVNEFVSSPYKTCSALVSSNPLPHSATILAVFHNQML